jgi:hypothetical protein
MKFGKDIKCSVFTFLIDKWDSIDFVNPKVKKKFVVFRIYYSKKKIRRQNFRVFGIWLLGELQYGQNETNYRSLVCVLSKFWPLLIFFKSL